MKHNPVIRDLDLAWESVNALAGTPVCAHDHVYNLAISDALKVIENLGGSDPAGMRHARAASPVMRGEDVLPASSWARRTDETDEQWKTRCRHYEFMAFDPDNPDVPLD